MCWLDEIVYKTTFNTVWHFLGYLLWIYNDNCPWLKKVVIYLTSKTGLSNEARSITYIKVCLHKYIRWKFRYSKWTFHKKAAQQNHKYGSTVDWCIQFSVWHNSSRPNRSIILRFYEDFGELQATVLCTVLVKMKFWFSLKSTLTKAHTFRRSDLTTSQIRLTLLPLGSATSSWIFHMPSTSFFPVPQKFVQGTA